jgi:tRNA-5-methyluridine54 2-sulfurtransferase
VKCRVCRGPAVIAVRRHNAAFCRDHFLHHCEEQVRRAIHTFGMLEPGERVLVAVSGGKDSLALWEILQRLGYQADGLYLGLGIGGYSDASAEYVREYVAGHDRTLITIDLAGDYGYGIPQAAAATRRAPCGSCGLSKRHLFNRAAIDHGYDVVATGHNLDDEAAVLLGNVLRWDAGYLGRQHPVLSAAPGFVRKVKPLVRLGEREMAAYCVLRGIDYQVEECPMAEGNRHLGYKEVLNALEDRSPGSKAAFLFGFLERGHQRFAPDAEVERGELGECRVCGSPTPGEVCAFCRLRAQVGAISLDVEPVPVVIGARPAPVGE